MIACDIMIRMSISKAFQVLVLVVFPFLRGLQSTVGVAIIVNK